MLVMAATGQTLQYCKYVITVKTYLEDSMTLTYGALVGRDTIIYEIQAVVGETTGGIESKSDGSDQWLKMG